MLMQINENAKNQTNNPRKPMGSRGLLHDKGCQDVDAGCLSIDEP